VRQQPAEMCLVLVRVSDLQEKHQGHMHLGRTTGKQAGGLILVYGELLKFDTKSPQSSGAFQAKNPGG
jgi:hypothetical protein